MNWGSGLGLEDGIGSYGGRLRIGNSRVRERKREREQSSERSELWGERDRAERSVWKPEIQKNGEK